MRFIERSFMMWLGSLLLSSSLAGAETKGGGEYQRLLGQLNGLESRVNEATQRLEQLVNQKNQSQDPKEKDSLIQLMIEEHQGLREQVTEYNRLRNEIRFRFPAEGVRLDELYGPRRPPSLEELESRSSLDVSLDRVQQTFQRHYGPLLSPDGGDGSRGPASSSPEEGAQGDKPGPPRLKLTR